MVVEAAKEIVVSIVQQSLADAEMLDVVKSVKEQLVAAGEGETLEGEGQDSDMVANSIPAGVRGNSGNSDLSIVFGPGASRLDLGHEGMKAGVPPTFSPKLAQAL